MEQQLKPIPNLFGTSFDGIISGVYKITSPSGKVYIGESKNIYNRWRQYKWLSSTKQRKLYDSFIEYGVYNHKFEIIHILDTNGGFIEYEHRPKLHTLEIMYIGQYKDFDNDLLNIHRGGKNKYYINKNGRKTKSTQPRIAYEIFNPNTSQIDIVTILDEYIEEKSIGCYKKLTSTLYGYDKLGNKNEFTKGFKIISKKCLLDNTLDEILQDSIESEKKRRYEVRLSKNIVDLGSPEYSIKCSNILREFIYTYINISTLKIGTIDNMKRFCREQKPPIQCEKQLTDTLYGINNQGNVVSHCHGLKIISKQFRDTSKDSSIIDNYISEMKNKRFAKRQQLGRTDEGSVEHIALISKNSMKYVYTIFNTTTKKTFIVDNVSDFMSTYTESKLPKNFSSIAETIYQYTARGHSLKSCHNFITLEKHYIDKNLNDNKLQKEINDEIIKRKKLNNLIPKDGYKVLHIESNEIKIVPIMADFCEQKDLVANYLLKTFKFPSYKHRGYRLVEKFIYYDQELINKSV